MTDPLLRSRWAAGVARLPQVVLQENAAATRGNRLLASSSLGEPKPRWRGDPTSGASNRPPGLLRRNWNDRSARNAAGNRLCRNRTSIVLAAVQLKGERSVTEPTSSALLGFALSMLANLRILLPVLPSQTGRHPGKRNAHLAVTVRGLPHCRNHWGSPYLCPCRASVSWFV
jgi:hypothetical protein